MGFAHPPPRATPGPGGFYDPDPAPASGGRELFLVFVLGASVLFLIAAISARQVTAPARATNMLRAGIATTTEIDLLLDENLPEMKRAAASDRAETWAIPGFPIEVVLTNAEVAELDEAQIRTMVLDRAAALVYDQGLDAFDTTGEQSIDFLSPQWALDLLIGQLSSSNHSRANLAAYLFGAVAMVASVLILLVSDAFSGFRRLGAGVAGGSLIGFALTGLAWLIAGQIGGDDAFMTDLRDIIRTVLSAPLRNFLIGAALGVFVFMLGPLLALMARRAGVETDDYAPADF